MSTGTRVRDSTYEVSIANTTASAWGVNRYFGVSVSAKTETKAAQIERVEIRAGLAMPAAPSTTDLRKGSPSSNIRWVFSMATVASSTRMPTASARPPSVMTLMVSPSAARIASEVRIESGIETSTTMVERQEPRKSRIVRPVSPAAITASWITPSIAAETKTDWSNNSRRTMPSGAAARMSGRAFLTLLTTSRVEAVPFLKIRISTDWAPSARTTLTCGGPPSRTKATSRTSTGWPETTLIGMRFSASRVSGEALSWIGYCCSPILARPDGIVRFCAVIALVTSSAVSPSA